MKSNPSLGTQREGQYGASLLLDSPLSQQLYLKTSLAHFFLPCTCLLHPQHPFLSTSLKFFSRFVLLSSFILPNLSPPSITCLKPLLFPLHLLKLVSYLSPLFHTHLLPHNLLFIFFFLLLTIQSSLASHLQRLLLPPLIYLSDTKMSSRRSRSRQPGVSRISDDQIADLVSKLQQLIPEIRNRRSDKVVWSFSQLSILNTCSYCVVFIFFSRDKFGLTHCTLIYFLWLI